MTKIVATVLFITITSINMYLLFITWNKGLLNIYKLHSKKLDFLMQSVGTEQWST